MGIRGARVEGTIVVDNSTRIPVAGRVPAHCVGHHKDKPLTRHRNVPLCTQSSHMPCTLAARVSRRGGWTPTAHRKSWRKRGEGLGYGEGNTEERRNEPPRVTKLQRRLLTDCERLAPSRDYQFRIIHLLRRWHDTENEYTVYELEARNFT